MFYKKIETKKDALEFIMGGTRSGDILERLEMLDSLIENSSQEEENEEDLQLA